MAVNPIPVLFAVRDTGHSSSAASTALMEAGAAVSMLRLRSPEQLLERLAEDLPALLVLEMDRDWHGLENLRTQFPQMPVVAVVTRRTEEMGFALSRLQVEDVWMLPLSDAALVERAQNVLNKVRARILHPERHHPNGFGSGRTSDFSSTAVTIAPPRGETGSISPPVMMGDNPRMGEIRETIEKVSGTDVTVLIRGESGVGKEVVARLLFEHSRRRLKPFVKVNCAAIPNDLLESELFGYEAGAFTGAVRAKPGKFELADHGTLFLDEIAEMHPSLQAKLLHVLQDGKFSRLGAKRDISVDVRVICATNKLLEERVREGLFREDLLYRINVVTIFLPPLRERRDEIPVLIDYLLRKYSAQYGRELHPFTPEVIHQMMAYAWPGNIRELENLCKRFVLVGNETQILRELSGRATQSAGGSPNGPQTASRKEEKSSTGLPTVPANLSLLEIGKRAAWEAERNAILQTLETTHWNRREASRRLHVSYKALLNKIKQMNLEDAMSGDKLDT